MKGFLVVVFVALAFVASPFSFWPTLSILLAAALLAVVAVGVWFLSNLFRF